MPNDEAVFYHALNTALGGEYGPLRKLHAAHGSWEGAWTSHISRIRHLGDSTPLDPVAAWQSLCQEGIAMVMRDDPSFPPLLREMPHPPHALYIKGAPARFKFPPIAVVGTRKATPEGIATALRFASGIAEAGVPIVSGLAFGIDAAAHQGALSAGGITVAVLAGGVDKVTPRSHERLGEAILARGGSFVSEYPPGSATIPRRFVERNRIVSGLCQAVVVIEVPDRSGAATTARFASEQNRAVFVVPGPITHPNYRGSHRLIRDGATLATCAEEVLADLGHELPQAAREETLKPVEREILRILRASRRSLGIDEITAAATLTSSVVNQALTMLALKNLVQEEGGRYGICN